MNALIDIYPIKLKQNLIRKEMVKPYAYYAALKNENRTYTQTNYGEKRYYEGVKAFSKNFDLKKYFEKTIWSSLLI